MPSNEGFSAIIRNSRENQDSSMIKKSMKDVR